MTEIGPDPGRAPFAGPPALSARGREVLLLLARGDTPKAIARRLGISVRTCRGHVQDLLVAFGTQSALHAVLEAQRFGLVPCRCGDKHAAAPDAVDERESDRPSG